jgi:SecD/SecF fusion protein
VADRRKYLLLMALIALALAGVASLAIPGSPAHKKVTLGLDLQGGLEVILKAQPRKGQVLPAGYLDTSVSIMRSRIDKLGVTEPEIRKQGSDQIVIQLAGVQDPAQAAQLIGKTAQLEFYDLEADLTGPSISANGFPIATPSLYALLSGQQALVGQKGASQWYLFKDKKLLVGPEPTKARLFTTRRAKKLGLTAASVSEQRTLQAATAKKKSKQPAKPKKPVYAALGVPNNTIVASCGKGTVVCPGVNQVNPTKTSWYLFKHTKPNVPNPIPEMTGADLKLSGTRADIDPTQGPVVLMQFTNKGGKIFQKITAAEAQRGHFRSSIAGQKVEQHFAIVLDRQIKSFPSIDFSQYPNGISGTNGAQITGLGSFGEAKNLALVLQTGALPVDFKQIEQTQVSATLGKDSLQQAKKAAIGGLIAVVVFLLLLYRFLGVIAVLGLGIYAAFLYAAILLFNVTLTLPGFAGLILTIGVAADANVVIFERIKEEVRAGKSVRAAIAAGYAKGFHTILDANVVTAITAMVLFAVATAGVKGFALMLLIGTVISLITAVAATRAMLGLLAGFRWFERPGFMGAHGTQGLKFLHIDFMRRRYLWFAISGAIIVVGIVSLFAQGLNLGIDFKGGTQFSFNTPAPTSLATVRSDVATAGYSDAIVQGRGKLTGSDKYKQFQIRTKPLPPKKQGALQHALENKVGATAFGIKNVSASFGRQIARNALLAIFFSLFLVVLYIAIRFDLKFAVPVILAMVHDVVVTVGVYSVTSREVSEATVAAVLTVLGYSIYDTIIIFDRIRENIPLMRRQSMATITNISLWETIRRSLATTFITLLPVGALFLFGGATLKDFAFALLVGITSGAYSSIFIAAPLLTIWKEREPEFARRKDVDMESAAGEAAFEEAEQVAAAEPAPELVPAAVERAVTGADAKRERRRQRRKSRPHGRAR